LKPSLYYCRINTTKQMELTKKALDKIKANPMVKNQIAIAMKCSEGTVRRWIINNDEMLTTASCLSVIRQATRLSDSQILQDRKN